MKSGACGARLGFMMSIVAMVSLRAETYYTATEGHDAHPGSADLPWRTIQHAANVMWPGDTVIVRAGAYNERVTTMRAGGGDANRIVFRADGTVTMKGWSVGHAYITIEGFDIAGWSSSDRNEAHVQVTAAGDNFHMIGCALRDGIQAVRDDIMFHAGDNDIVSQTGGFLDAGFAAGQTVYVGAAASGLSIANSGVYTITDVTDHAIGVTGSLVDEGPLPIYLSAGYVFGLFLYSGSESCVIRGNTFRNLGYDAWFILGSGHLLESNTVEQVNGWDAMHFGGAGHVFRRNIFQNSPLTVYQVSPDAWENYSPVPYFNVTFSNNVIVGFSGVLSSQKGADTSSGWLLTHNVFVDVGRFNLTHPGTEFRHNTFLRVARQHNPVVSRAPHPVRINSSLGATNVVVLNNIFVDCGEPAPSQTEPQVGWYEILGPTDSVTTAGNFVAGGSPIYGSKVGWSEDDPDMNGGAPGFVNTSDPLGPDGLPFTADDGLRLLASSKLIGAGVNDATPGAYSAVLDSPVLGMQRAGAGEITILWSERGDTWTLQGAHTVVGPWADLTNQAVWLGDLIHVTVPMTNHTGFYRLRF